MSVFCNTGGHFCHRMKSFVPTRRVRPFHNLHIRRQTNSTPSPCDAAVRSRGKFVPGRIGGEGAIQIFCSGCRRGIFWPLISHLVGCPKAQQTHRSPKSLSEVNENARSHVVGVAPARLGKLKNMREFRGDPHRWEAPPPPLPAALLLPSC